VQEILVALALMLVFEGIWPFVSPESFRRALAMIALEGSRPIRIAGLLSMVLGVGLLYLVR
jgi:uncharacterized protein